MVSNDSFREMALAFNGVSEQPHFHKASFWVKNKIFSTLEELTQIAVFKLNKKGQTELIRLDDKAVYPVVGKWGLKGWTSVELKLVEEDLVRTGLKMAYDLIVSGSQQNNPLHGVKLADILDHLVEEYGWERMGRQVTIRCFTHDPSIKSSLKFLRKTPWARAKVEEMYLRSLGQK